MKCKTYYGTCLFKSIHFETAEEGVLTAEVLTQMDKEILIVLESEEENVDFLGFKRYNEGLKEALNRDFSIALVFRSSLFPMPHNPPVKLLYWDFTVGEMLYGGAPPSYKGRAVEVFKGFVIYPDLLPRKLSEKIHVKLVYLKRTPQFISGLDDSIEDPVYGEPSPKVHMFILKKLKVSAAFSDIATGIVGFNARNS
ncbi:hypothetical protein KEJ27_07530 [Candidatus Bathyarchaeota archaeon]|nr:hypothetical protein [Candidatus Bathyarchaeota archaeon]MBS7613697.1 hypothetical protein [Candidatus Bathyarchaeota archaeon]